MSPSIPHPTAAEQERIDVSARYRALTEAQKQCADAFLGGYINLSFSAGESVDTIHAFRSAVAYAEGK